MSVYTLRRRIVAPIMLLALSTAWAGESSWLNPDNLPPQLQHPLKLLATTALSGEGKDFYSLKPGATATIGTITGPAIIFRIWSTTSNTKMASLDMIVDGKKETLYERGELPPTVMRPDPLRSMDMQAYCSYNPIFVKKQAVFQARSFEQGVTEPMKFYLQAGYRSMSAAELAQAETLDLAQVRVWLGRLQAPGYTGTTDTGAQTLSGEIRRGAPWQPTIQGPALITNLQLQPVGDSGAAGPTPAQLQTTRLVITCDGNRTLDVPLGLLFGVGHKLSDYQSAGLSTQGQTLSLRFPMPVASNMTIGLDRFGRKGIAALAAQATVLPLKQAPKYRFCAQYFSQISVQDQPMTLLNVTGEGLFVGTSLSVNGLQRKTFAFLEGNEQIYIDGDSKPTIEGTGAEDYFNNAWYFEAGEKTHLFHGVTFKQDKEPPIVDCYRQLISDCIPFRQSLRFDLQHGSRNKAPDVLYEGVMFWYQTPPVSVAEPVAVRIPKELLPEGMQRPGGLPLLMTILGFIVALAFVGLLAWGWLYRRRS